MALYRISELDNIRQAANRARGFEDPGMGFIGSRRASAPGLEIPIADEPAPGNVLDTRPGFVGYSAPAPGLDVEPTPAMRSAAPTRRGLGATLADALQGFAAGASANVGRATGPGDMRTSILNALTGVGRLSSARGEAARRAAERRQGLSDKLAMSLALRETPEQAAAKAKAVEGVKQPYRLEMLNAAAKNARDKVTAAVRAQSGNLTAAQQIELNNKVLDQVDQRFARSFNYNPTPEEMSAMVTAVKRDMLSGTKIVNVPPELE